MFLILTKRKAFEDLSVISVDIKVLIQRQSTENTEGTEEEQEPQKYLQVFKDPTKMINGFDLISVISVYSVDKKGFD